MSKKGRITILIFIAVSFVLFALKMLFCGIAPDEEYQIAMSYRIAMGDGLFNRSWDTIQTSGFVNYFLIKIFLYIFGTTTGLVIFLRFFGIVFQFATSVIVYKCINRHLNKSQALLVSSFSLFSLSKIIITPDFSNMLIWFLTICVCILWIAYDSYLEGGTFPYFKLILSGIFFSLCVLSQACLILIPIMAVMLCFSFKKNRIKANVVFFGTCALSAVLYVIYILVTTGYSNMIRGINGILVGDFTHSSGMNITGASKPIAVVQDALVVFAWLAVCAFSAFILSYIFSKLSGKQIKFDVFSFIYIVLTGCVTLYYWLIKESGYDALKLYLPALLVIALVYLIIWKRKKDNRTCDIPFFGVLLGLGVFLNVLFISNVPLINNLSFLIPAVLWALVLIAMTKEQDRNGVLVVVVLLTITGSVLTLNSSPAGCTVFDCVEKIDYGPAKGTYTSEYVSNVYNEEGRTFSSLIPEYSTVLIVSNCDKNTLLYYCYLMNGINISHYSVNSTPSYSYELAKYWEIYKDKFPDVIFVNKTASFGWEFDFIFDYIEKYFGYSRVESTEYGTYYFR